MRLLGAFEDLGSKLFFSDVEPFKYNYQIGLETLVVYTMNLWTLYVELIKDFVYKLTLKCLAWGVKLQRLNLNRLAGVCLNGGACGLIRQSAPNLTNILRNLVRIV